jgi:hypothetical protein
MSEPEITAVLHESVAKWKFNQKEGYVYNPAEINFINTDSENVEFTTPANYIYPTQIEVTGGVAKLKTGDETETNWDLVTPGDYTYNPDAVIVDGVAKLKDQIETYKSDTGAVLYASYDEDIDLTWAIGTLTGTGTGSPNVSGGRLDLTGGGTKYVRYDEDNHDLTQTGAIRFKWTPDYNGVPPTIYYLLDLRSESPTAANRIALAHSATGGGNIFLFLNDSTGTPQLANAVAPVVAIADQVYEIELNFNFTSGLVELYINGVREYSNATLIFTRTASIDNIVLGSVTGGTTPQDCFFDNFIMFNEIQHSGSDPIPVNEPIPKLPYEIVCLPDTYAIYEFNESSGTNAQDTSGNGRDGTTVNMHPVNNWVTGKLNNALLFEAADQEYVSLPSSFGNWEWAQPLTFSFWAKHTMGAASGFIIDRQEAATPFRGWGVYWQGSSEKYHFLLQNTITGPISLQVAADVSGLDDGNWHHVFISYSGNGLASGVKWYINGDLVPNSVFSDTLAGQTILNSGNPYIGSRNGSLHLDGTIDQLAVWDTELLPCMAEFIYNGGSGTEEFSKNAPFIYPTAGQAFYPNLKEFTTVQITSLVTTLRYQCSIDGGTTWLWYNGGAWVTSDGTIDESNTVSEVNTNINSLGESGDFNWRAILRSDDGTETPELDNVYIKEQKYPVGEFELEMNSDIQPDANLGYVGLVETAVTPAGTSLMYKYSLDSGLNYFGLNGSWLTFSALEGILTDYINTAGDGTDTLRLKIKLTTSDEQETPEIDNILIQFYILGYLELQTGIDTAEIIFPSPGPEEVTEWVRIVEESTESENSIVSIYFRVTNDGGNNWGSFPDDFNDGMWAPYTQTQLRYNTEPKQNGLDDIQIKAILSRDTGESSPVLNTIELTYYTYSVEPEEDYEGIFTNPTEVVTVAGGPKVLPYADVSKLYIDIGENKLISDLDSFGIDYLTLLNEDNKARFETTLKHAAIYAILCKLSLVGKIVSYSGRVQSQSVDGGSITYDIGTRYGDRPTPGDYCSTYESMFQKIIKMFNTDKGSAIPGPTPVQRSNYNLSELDEEYWIRYETDTELD